MTPAEFRCAREYLGLPINWLAAYMDVAERTVNRWETATTPIPEHARAALSNLLVYTEGCVEKTVKAGLKRPLVTSADTSPEISPKEFPASWHRMLCSRIVERTNVAVGYGAAMRPTFKVPVRP